MTIDNAAIQTITDQLSTNVRPQDDFFRYVNGTWLDSTEIPADQSSTGSFMDLHNESERRVREIIEELGKAAAAGTASPDEAKIGDLFNSFMDEDRVNERGARPLDPDVELIAAAPDKKQLASVIGQLYRSGVGAPFWVEIDADRNNPHEYIAWIGQSGLGLPDEAYYRAPEHADTLAAYREFVPKMFGLVRNASPDDATAAAERIIEFETALASHHFTVVEERDVAKTNNVMAWDDFIASAPGFDWEEALSSYGLTRELAPELLVYTPRALTGFAREWESADLETLKLYMMWRAIRARAAYLSSDIVNLNFDFYGRTLSGQPELKERWKRGVSLVDGVMGEAVGRVYVRKHFPPEYKAKMEQLVADLLAAYKESITNLTWMTDGTKAKALEKLSQFTPKIAYPNKWRDYSELTTSNGLVENVRAANEFETAFELGKLGKPVNRDEWHMYPQTVNAYYNPVANEIVFPAAILQPPFFDPQADDAINYGGIGAVIGHEIGHGFDDQGSQYDGTGKLNNWWTEADREEFEARTAALVNQYDAYTPKQLGPDSAHHVQGALTLGENIGDLGGLTIALKAYDIAMRRAGLSGAADAPIIKGFTGVQRVLLSYAHIWQEKRRDEITVQYLAIDPHSPAEFRCNGIVKNLDEFADEFGVQPGDELYLAPEDRVHIW